MLIQVPSVPSDYWRWFPPTSTLPLDKDKRATALQEAFEAYSTEAVLTVDEHDSENPRKPLPLYGQMAYLRVAIWAFMRYRRLYWCKGRKVAATVLLTEILTWINHYRSHRLWGWVTQDKKDGSDLVERYVKHGYVESHPKWLKARYIYGQSKGDLVIARRNGWGSRSERVEEQVWDSELRSYPAGADQLRQFPHSGVVIDEGHVIPDLPGLIQGTTPGLRAAEGLEGGKLVIVFVARKGAYVEYLAGPHCREAIKLAKERLSPAA